jgi:hypothetical protein
VRRARRAVSVCGACRAVSVCGVSCTQSGVYVSCIKQVMKLRPSRRPELHDLFVCRASRECIQLTGVPHSQENAPPWDPTVGLCLGSYRGFIGRWAFSWGRSTPVFHNKPQSGWAKRCMWVVYLSNKSTSYNKPLLGGQICRVQGYLAHEKLPPPSEAPEAPGHSPTVGS